MMVTGGRSQQNICKQINNILSKLLYYILLTILRSVSMVGEGGVRETHDLHLPLVLHSNFFLGGATRTICDKLSISDSSVHDSVRSLVNKLGKGKQI